MKTAFVLCFILAVGVGGIPAKSRQSRDYAVINGRNYYISPNGTSYHALEALRICNAEGMKMASVETAELENHVITYLDQNGYEGMSFWLGAMMYTTPPTMYIWTGTGQQFTYTNWYSGEPNSEVVNDVCVFLNVYRQWADIDCTTAKWGVICEEL